MPNQSTDTASIAEAGRRCPSCGQPLTEDAPHGLCPRCLGRSAVSLMGSAESSEASDPFSLTFGRFKLLGELGRGGAGAVFRARDTATGEIVALKVLLQGRFASPNHHERFAREAEAIVTLRHPGIVTLREVGEHEGQPFLAMQWIEGQTLEERARRQPLPPREAARVIREVAQAVQHAHELGIVHRDLKPSNILVDASGQPHVTDFGLAHAILGESNLTRTGDALGTPGYMPPEQASTGRGAVLPASDVYSLGAVLYFLLTGRPPFLAANFHDTVAEMLQNDPTAPRRLNSAVPRDLETICLKCLEKQPHRRYAAAHELTADLDSFLRDKPVAARRVSGAERAWRWCRRRPGLAAFVVAGVAAVGVSLAALLIGYYQVDRARRMAEAARETAEASAVQEHSTVIRLLLERGWDAFAQGEPMNAAAFFLAAWQQDTTTPAPLHAMRVQWALRAAPSLRRMGFHDGQVRSLGTSVDGGIVAAGGQDGLLGTWDLKLPQRLASSLRVSEPVHNLCLSPDGQTLVASAGESKQAGGHGDGHVYVWNLSRGWDLSRRIVAESYIENFAVNDDFTRLVTVTDNGGVQVWDLTDGRQIFPTMRHSAKVLTVRFSPDGQEIVTAAWDSTAVVWNSRTGDRIATLKHPEWLRYAEFSPDGNRIATGCDDGFARLWQRPWGTSEPLKLAHAGRVRHAVFSPDGRYVATASVDRTARIWDAGSGAPASSPLQHAHTVLRVRFSHDSTRLISASDDQTARVWAVPQGDSVTAPLRHGSAVAEATFVENRTDRVVTASWDGCVRFWQLGQGLNAVSEIPFWRKGVRSAGPGGNTASEVKFSPPDSWDSELDVTSFGLSADGRLLHATLHNGQTAVWSTQSGEISAGPKQINTILTSGRLSPDDSTFLLGGADGLVRAWALGSNEIVESLTRHSNAVLAVAWNPDGKTYATACGTRAGPTPGRDGYARLWHAADHSPIGDWMPHPGRVTCVAFSPDGELILSGCGDGKVRFWNTSTKTPSRSDLPHGGDVRSVAFSGDGHLLLVAGGDGVAKLWRVDSWELIHATIRHAGGIRAEFSPDDRFIVTVGRDNSARIWETGSGLAVSPPLIQGGPGSYASFARDQKSIITLTSHGKMHRWLLPDGQLSLVDATRDISLLSALKVDSRGAISFLQAPALKQLWDAIKPPQPGGSGKP